MVENGDFCFDDEWRYSFTMGGVLSLDMWTILGGTHVIRLTWTALRD